jgi:S1-C subfamily serine protease
LESKVKAGTSRYKYFKNNKDEFVIEATLEFIKNKKEDLGGIIYGFKDWNNYNFFLIDQEHLYLGTVFEGVKTYGIKGMYSHTINSKGNNTLKLIAAGDDAIFTINGNYVYKASQLPNYGNNIGAMIEGKFTAKLDKFTFKQLSNTTLGSGRTITGGQTDVKATGTGFFIAPNGLIVTNYHVVETAKQIVVDVLDSTSQTYKSYQAQVVLNDADNDLSIIKINDDQFKPIFSKIEYGLGNSFDLGSTVYTLGFPLALSGMGSQEAKFTDGKISAKTGYNGAINSFQTTIPVQPGNSGGPIFNNNGDLIGIINSKIAKADNVSYGIKNSMLINLSQSLSEEVILNAKSELNNASLEENIKRLKKYVVLIRIK